MQYYIIDTFIKMKEGGPHLSDDDISGDEEDLSGSEILDHDSNIPQVQPSSNAANAAMYSDDDADSEGHGLLGGSKAKKSRKRSKSPSSLRPKKRGHERPTSTDGESLVGSGDEDLERGAAYKLKKKRNE